MSSNNGLGIPSAEQLSATRVSLWHQGGEALLTIEGLRAWVNRAGLVMFLPRAGQMGPAASFVEAVLGKARAAPELAEIELAKGLLARLVAEGTAVPLNLLGETKGAGTDTPDFVASAAVFAYVFTLRGDKTWKQAPATAGAVKVSPLALAAYEALGKRGGLPVYDLATELGKEVTEAAVLRALTELWTHLRVIPVGQADGAATVWELATARYTKQMKAGANAGQPSALSALITLYLGQVVMASEEEVETFLSPLAARSRIRDVVHALMGARQVETVAVEGRTLVHVSGGLPTFGGGVADMGAVEAGEAGAEAGEGAVGSEASAGGEETIAVERTDRAGEGRITKFVAKPRKLGTGFAKKFVGGKGFGAGAAGEGRPERERRPFSGGAKGGFAKPGVKKAGFVKPGFSKPGFTRPWEEEKAARQAVEAPAGSGGEGIDVAAGEGGGGFAEARAEKKTFSKPGTFGRKREGFAGKRTFGEARAPQRFVGKRDFGGGERESRGEGGEGGRPAFRKFDAPRGDRPAFKKFEAGGAGRPAFKKFDGPRGERPAFKKFDSPRGDRPAFKKFDGAGGARPPFKRSDDARGERPAFRKFDAPRGDRPARPFDRERPARAGNGEGGERPARTYGKSAGGYGAKAGGSGLAGKKPYSKGPGDYPARKKSFGKPGGGTGGGKVNTFTKFADGNNPFRKPGPGSKKYGPKAGGAGKPAYRKRKDEGEGS